MGCQHTVLLLSSEAIGWSELRQILADLPDIRVVGDTTDLAAARRLAAAHVPDTIIAATTLGNRPILPLLADLRRSCCPTTKAILLAADYAPSQLRSPEDTGVVGYLLWVDLSPALLRHCLAAAITGDVILGSGEIVRQFIAGLRGEGPARLAAARISVRERAVLGRLAAGQTREEIAIAEGISLTTVKRLIADLEARLSAPNQFVLAVEAMRLGVIR